MDIADVEIRWWGTLICASSEVKVWCEELKGSREPQTGLGATPVILYTGIVLSYTCTSGWMMSSKLHCLYTIAIVMTDLQISKLHHVLSRHSVSMSLRNQWSWGVGGMICQQSYCHLVLCDLIGTSVLTANVSPSQKTRLRILFWRETIWKCFLNLKDEL